MKNQDGEQAAAIEGEPDVRHYPGWIGADSQPSQLMKGNLMCHRRSLIAALSTVLWIAAVLPVSAQHFQQIARASLSQISVGSANNIWGVNPQGQIFRLNSINSQFDLMPGSLAQIAVGGGNTFQADAVWGVNFAQQIFHYYGGTWQQVAGVLSSIVVGTGTSSCYPYEVWGINSNHQAWRFNNCTGGWEGVSGLYSQIATGGGEVWALNAISNSLYPSIYRFNPATGQFVLMPGSLTQITVGPGGVWGVYAPFRLGTQSVWQFSPATQNWFQVPGALRAIVAGGNEVWGLIQANHALKLTPSTQTWTQFTGTFSQLAIGSGGGIWAIDSSNRVYAFMTP